MIFEIETLLAPISPELPAGPNLREAGEGSIAYYRIKDARSAARIAERQADAEAERAPLAGEWRLIFDQAQHVLATQSKDLEVAAWLTEASIRLHGFAGLRASFLLLAGLVDRYWDGLHSVDTEDVAAKVAPIAGLNGVGGEGSLIQPMRLAPLTSAHGGESAGLWHYMVMRKRGAACAEAVLLADATRATDSAAFTAIYRDIGHALNSHGALTARLDLLCGDESPPSSTIRNTLIEAQDALRDFATLDAAALDDPEAAARTVAAPATQDDEAPASAAPVQASNSATGPLRTRDDALRELVRVAAFFRENEPNSPTAYTLQTLIRRARLPLADLLLELIPDEAQRRSTLNLAGIGPEVSEK